MLKSWLYYGGDKNVNVEVKFGDIDKTFPGINKFNFNRLLNYFTFTQKSLSTIYFNNNIKKIINNDLSVIYKEKRCINYIYDDQYNLHYFINTETIIDEPDNYNSNYSKEKLKYIYKFNKNIELELSESTIKNEEYLLNVYEVELKLKNGDTDIFDNIIYSLLKVLQQTDVLYTHYQVLNLNKIINNVGGLVKTKNVKIDDIDKNIKNDLYIVSTKAKGLRCMLIINNEGVWLAKPPYYYNLLINTDNDYFNHFKHSFHTSIFDGELITPINKTRYEFNYKYWFLCYDCLMFNQSNVTKLNYGERIDYAKTLKRLMTWYIDPYLLNVDLKTTRQFSNKNEFNESVRYLLNVGSVLNYNHNGLIFTPVLQPYHSIVYKWIYPTMTTIDFALYPTGDQVKLYLYNEDVKKDIEFMGTSMYPFDESMILQSSFKNINKKQIAECRWDQILNKMVFVKIRDDKNDADSVDLAIENWNNMNHPLIGDDCCN